jgi:SEC-C motif-containing protein
MISAQVGRNDPCPCGSGNKFKRCHGSKSQAPSQMSNPSDKPPWLGKRQSTANISEAAIRQYCGYMEWVKQRIEAIKSMGSSPIKNRLHGFIQIESIYLQFRKILELIAMGSLLNNKEEYAKARANFDSDWNARRILENLAKVNPDFYPKPIVDVNGDFQPVQGALTKDDFVTVYDRCGEVLHTANPFGKTIDYQQMSNEITGWLSKTMMLLNQHQLFMLDDGFWLVQMQTTTSDRVQYSRWALVGPVGEIKNEG